MDAEKTEGKDEPVKIVVRERKNTARVFLKPHIPPASQDDYFKPVYAELLRMREKDE